MIPGLVLDGLYRRANGQRGRVTPERFAEALEASAAKAFEGQTPSPRDRERYLSSLHLEDLALACACADADNDAWDYFVLEYRPVLYRAADALDPKIAPAAWGEYLRLRGALHAKRGSAADAYHDFAQSATLLDLLGERYQSGLSHLALGRLVAETGARSIARSP